MPDHEVYARFALTVERFFANKVTEPSVVEDLMHETFLRFFQRRAQSQGRPPSESDPSIDSPGRFLIGVAKNVLFEFWRATVKRERIDDIGEQSIADLVGLPSRISQAERLAVVRELLRELPLHQQMVLELHYWQGVSYKDIATMLGVPFGTVATWGRAGRNTVRLRLTQALNANVADDAEPTSAHPWYEPRTGAVDLDELAATAMLGARGAVLQSTPEWLLALELPAHLPGATASELSEIAKAAWEAWVEAGRPTGS